MNIREEILVRTDRGLNVFHYYMPIDFKIKKSFRNPFYEDRNASCNIYFDSQHHCYRMKDFGNELYTGDCFWFVAMILGVDVRSNFIVVLETIIKDLRLQIAIPERVNNSTLPHSIVQPKIIVANKTEGIYRTSPEKNFKYTERPFSSAEIEFWLRFGIKESTLKRFHVKALSRYESISNRGKAFSIVSTNEEPIFAYFMDGFVKLYRPYSRMRFLYGGEKVEDYAFGLEQLPNKGDMIFITGGEKDVLSLSAHGFDAISFNSETAQIPEPLIKMLSRRFKHIILLYDMDETGVRSSLEAVNTFIDYNLLRLELPLRGIKEEKDISDYFSLGNTESDFKILVKNRIINLYAQTMMVIRSCEIDYENPPDASKAIISVNSVPLGTQDNLFCVTGGEGTGKSNYISAILAGAINDTTLPFEATLGLKIQSNPKGLAVLHFDTEQSESQLHKNLGKTLRRSRLDAVPEFYHSLYLASLSRKERMKLIRESMDLFHYQHSGIHLVVIDGIADLIKSANDEAESIAIVDELYRLAGIYNTCILCVLHFVPNGIKLRGHIGSELQRKAAAILSIEKDDNPALSVVKALKVRDGSPLDVPMMLFGWDKEQEMHIYQGEKSQEVKEKRKVTELGQIAKEVFRIHDRYSYNELVVQIMQTVDVKERTAKSYISFMRVHKIIHTDNNNQYHLKL